MIAGSMRITHDWLVAHRACSDAVEVFDKRWPEGVELSLEALREALELDLDLGWLAIHILPTSLRVEYERQVASLLAEYERQVASLLAEYQRQVAPLRAEYERQVAQVFISFLWPTHEEVLGP